MRTSTITLFFLAVLVSVSALAQKSIDGQEISEAAKKGANISYEGVTIKGMVDFTNYSEEKGNIPGKVWRWWGTETKKDERMINGKIVFKNCTFTDDVIAYILAGDEYLFTASFSDEVIFENCTFKGAAAFKYSDFSRNVSFSRSSFAEEANFKYAKFQRYADFSRINARIDANFKYAKFRRAADFSSAFVRHEANFKYAKFDEGMNLQNADINGLLNFKYVNIEGELNTKNARIGDLDTKYAKVNGSSFNKYLLSSRD